MQNTRVETAMLILIVEDSRPLAANTIEFLESEGFECDYAERGDHALELSNNTIYDAMVLDVMLPGMDGLQLCQTLRQRGNAVPIIMLTARDTLDDELQGFDCGADDYLVKPFDFPELSARLKVMLRLKTSTQTVLRVGDLSMHVGSHKTMRAGQRLELNPIGWKILEALMRASPNVVSKEKIESLIWSDETPDSDALKSHLYQLRQAVDKPFSTPLIHTVRGVGVVLRHSEL